MSHIRLQQFDGPFELLLSLVDEQKLDISEIALSHVTEQYLQYLDTLGKNRAEELADFLVIATRLLLLKAKRLLPQFAPEEEEGPGLEEQLRLYKQFVEASKRINAHWMSQARSVFRVEPPKRPTEFAPPGNLSEHTVHAAMTQLLDRLKPPKPLPHTTIDRAVSMKEKIDRLRQMLKERKQLFFHETLDNARNKTDIIVSFIAMLELAKQHIAVLHQDDAFHDIRIERFHA